MTYIITPNAEQISRTAWRDMRKRSSTTVTTHWWSVITHPGTGDAALSIDEDEEFQIKPDATGDNFIPLMDIPSQAERDKGRQDIVNGRGIRIQVRNLLPQSVRSALMTREQMQTGGWFGEQAREARRRN